MLILIPPAFAQTPPALKAADQPEVREAGPIKVVTPPLRQLFEKGTIPETPPIQEWRTVKISDPALDPGNPLSELRSVRIYEGINGTTNAGMLFHAPVLSFIETKDGVQGAPKTVHRIVRHDSEGTADIVFQVALSSPVLRRAFQEELGKSAPTQVWPLVGVVVSLRTLSGAELAVAFADGLSSRTESIEIVFQVPTKDVDDVVRGLAEDQLRIHWWTLLYGRPVKAAASEVNGDAALELAIKANLSNDQLATGTEQPAAPIFQLQKNEIMRDVRINLRRSVRANDPTLLPLVDQVSLTTLLFDSKNSVTVEQLRSEFPKFEDAASDYLKPHLEAWAKSTATEERIVDTKEKEYKKESQRSSDGGPLARITGDKGGTDTTIRRELDKLEKTTGATFKFDEKKQRWRPQSFNVTALRVGRDHVSLKSAVDAVIVLDGLYYWVFEGSVRPDYTLSRVEEVFALRQREEDGVRAELEKRRLNRQAEWARFRGEKNKDWLDGVTVEAGGRARLEVDLVPIPNEPKLLIEQLFTRGIIQKDWKGYGSDGICVSVTTSAPGELGITRITGVRNNGQSFDLNGENHRGVCVLHAGTASWTKFSGRIQGVTIEANPVKIVFRGRTYQLSAPHGVPLEDAPDATMWRQRGAPGRQILTGTMKLLVKGIEPEELLPTQVPDWFSPLPSTDQVRKELRTKIAK